MTTRQPVLSYRDSSRARGPDPALRRTGQTAALPLAAAALVLAVAAAGPAPAGAPASDVPPPAPPAFYTQHLGSIADIQGDAFAFTRDDGQKVRIRLLDADCAPLGNTVRTQAQAIASKLLEEAPFWVFPVGRTQGGEANEVWADVWTAKGWLSQVLIRAGYAQRRTEPALSALATPDTAGTSNKGPAPAAPAFVAPSCKPTAGDTFEIESGTRKFAARLFDAACEGVPDAQRTEAGATATRLVGSGAVWVFPCAPPPIDGKGEWPVRLWTAEGWLSDVLVRAGQAKRSEGVDKAAVASATKPAPAPRPEPAKQPAPKKPAEQTIEWKPVPIRLTVVTPPTTDTMFELSASASHLESQVFKTTSGVWRLTWNGKPEQPNARLVVQVLRYGGNQPDSTDKVPSSQVFYCAQPAGNQVLQTAPGNYWIKITNTTTATAKVEEAFRKESTP